MQCLLYLSAILILTVIDLVTGESFVLEQIFDYAVNITQFSSTQNYLALF